MRHLDRDEDDLIIRFRNMHCENARKTPLTVRNPELSYTYATDTLTMSFISVLALDKRQKKNHDLT